MSTLTPEEVQAIAAAHTDEHYGDDCIYYETDFVGFAAALEAELRKRWFAEPVAYMDRGDFWPAIEWPMTRESAEPLYAAPTEES